MQKIAMSANSSWGGGDQGEEANNEKYIVNLLLFNICTLYIHMYI